MQFIHTADWHIGSSRSLPGYLERQVAMIDGIYGIAGERNIEIVIVAGDVVDRVDLTPQEKDMIIDRAVYYDRKGFKTVYVMGNHDIVEMNAQGKYSHIRTLKNLVDRSALKNTWVVERGPRSIWFPAREDKESADDLLIFAIPNGFSADHATAIEMTYRKAKLGRETPFKFVVVIHELISGSVNDSGFKFQSKFELISSKDVDYFALGDVHKPQQIASNAWYCGSPIQHNFGDELPRGVMVVDLKRDLDGPELVPIPGVRPLMTMSIDDVQDFDNEDDAYVRLEHSPGELIPPVPGLVTTKIRIDENMSTEDVVVDLNLDSIFSGVELLLMEEGLEKDECEEAVSVLMETQGSSL